MAFENITMNLTALQNIEPFTYNQTEVTLQTMVQTANSVTNDLVIAGSLFLITLIMYLALTDKTPLQEFGFDDARGLLVSFCAAAVMGLNIIEVGWSPNFFVVGMFITMWIFNLIFIWIYENSE